MYGGTADPNRQRFRTLALLSGLLVSVPYLWVGYRVLSVVGDVSLVYRFLGLSVAAVVVALPLARRLSTRRGLAVAFGGFLLGLGGYLLSVPVATIRAEWLLVDVATLLSGLSVFQILRADLWVFAITPAPLFASWYLLFGRRYVSGALVGSAVVTFFLMTGDLGTTSGLVAAVGVIGIVGFGRLELEGGTGRHRDALLSLIAAVFLVTAGISLVSVGAGSVTPEGGTVESNLIGDDDQLTIQGSISLSPEERFEVESSARSYWRVGSFDRYTGAGWIRTGRTSQYDDGLGAPPGETETISQSYEMRSRFGAVPAAWKPVDVSANARARVTSMDGFQAREALTEGERYTVRSLRPDPSTEALRNGDGPYPDRIANRYLDLPASTPDRVGKFTDDVTGDADDPYETANRIETWLEANRNYSLDVNRPNGDIAASFLFDMNRGYCTYFATTMVAMLRSQDIPARFVVGYTPGERIGENRWLARGLDSHAWVEVYFSNVGWVRFDPTPAGPRRAAERQQLNGGGDGGGSGPSTSDGPTSTTETGVIVTPPDGPSTATDPPGGTAVPTTGSESTPTESPGSTTAESPDSTDTPTLTETSPSTETATSTETPPPTGTPNTTGSPPPTTPNTTETATAPGPGPVTEPGVTTGPPTATEATDTPAGPPESGDEVRTTREPTPPAIDTPEPEGPLSGIPDPATLPRNTLPTGLFLLGGVTLLARVRVRERVGRARWLYAPPGGTPAEQINGVYDRLEHLLARRFRPRRPGETPREYVDDVCDGSRTEAAMTILERYEDARYAGTVTEEDATTAKEAFESMYRRFSAVWSVRGRK
jgi:transglutaminase-like putative cysteine protease